MKTSAASHRTFLPSLSPTLLSSSGRTEGPSHSSLNVRPRPKTAALPLKLGTRCVWGQGSSGLFGGNFSKPYSPDILCHWVVWFAWFSWPMQKSFPFSGWEKLQQQSFSCLKVNGIAASLRPEKQEQGCSILALIPGELS